MHEQASKQLELYIRASLPTPLCCALSRPLSKVFSWYSLTALHPASSCLMPFLPAREVFASLQQGLPDKRNQVPSTPSPPPLRGERYLRNLRKHQHSGSSVDKDFSFLMDLHENLFQNRILTASWKRAWSQMLSAISMTINIICFSECLFKAMNIAI